MNKILVPTDFSDNAAQALRYAVMLAKKTGAELLLLNVYEIYIPVDGEQILHDTHEIEEEAKKEQLLAEVKEFIPGDVKYRLFVEPGSPVYKIAQIAEDHNADLIVMGIRGCNKLQQIIVGSTTTALIRNSKIPVFVIPENAKIEAPDKILFAFDGKEIPAKETMQPLKDIATIYNAEILALNVINDLELKLVDKKYIVRQIYHALGDANYSVHFEENGDVLQGINNFIDEYDVNAIAMIFKHHSLFNRIITESRAHKMAFYTQKPLIILHEKEEQK